MFQHVFQLRTQQHFDHFINHFLLIKAMEVLMIAFVLLLKGLIELVGNISIGILTHYLCLKCL